MDKFKQFLEADAKRTQGEWFYKDCSEYSGHGQWSDWVDCKGLKNQSNICECDSKDTAEFIAAASRIAPDLTKMLDDMRVAVETLTQIEHNLACERYVREFAGKALARLKPYEKLFEKEGERNE